MDDPTYAEIMGKLSELHQVVASLDAGVQALVNVIDRLLAHTQAEYARDVALAQTEPRHPWAH